MKIRSITLRGTEIPSSLNKKQVKKFIAEEDKKHNDEDVKMFCKKDCECKGKFSMSNHPEL